MYACRSSGLSVCPFPEGTRWPCLSPARASLASAPRNDGVCGWPRPLPSLGMGVEGYAPDSMNSKVPALPLAIPLANGSFLLLLNPDVFWNSPNSGFSTWNYLAPTHISAASHF